MSSTEDLFYFCPHVSHRYILHLSKNECNDIVTVEKLQKKMSLYHEDISFKLERLQQRKGLQEITSHKKSHSPTTPEKTPAKTHPTHIDIQKMGGEYSLQEGYVHTSNCM